MAFPVASGPQYTDNFKPEIWSSTMNVEFYKSTVFSEIANTDFEQEVFKFGDTVNIRTIPEITVWDYQEGLELNVQTPDSPKLTLLIDKGKYFNVALDDVAKKQSDLPLLQQWSKDAGLRMKIAIDADVLGNVYADAHASNKGATAGADSGDINMGVVGTPVALTSTNILESFMSIGTILDEQDAPDEGRFIVMPPWAALDLKLSDLKSVYITGDPSSPIRTGKWGKIDKFTLFTSRQLPTGTDGGNKVWHILGGQHHAITFASQIEKVQHLEKVPNSFMQLIRGLNVYGYKVVKPEALVDLYVRKG